MFEINLLRLPLGEGPKGYIGSGWGERGPLKLCSASWIISFAWGEPDRSIISCCLARSSTALGPVLTYKNYKSWEGFHLRISPADGCSWRVTWRPPSGDCCLYILKMQQVKFWENGDKIDFIPFVHFKFFIFSHMSRGPTARSSYIQL